MTQLIALLAWGAFCIALGYVCRAVIDEFEEWQ